MGRISGPFQRDLVTLEGSLEIGRFGDGVNLPAGPSEVAPMTPMPRSRPFTLRDALALVMATAAGLGATRSLADLQWISTLASVDTRGVQRCGWVVAAFSPSDSPRPQGVSHATYWSQRIAFWPCPCLAAWTLAVLALAFLPPRPPWRRLLRRPGILAGLAWIASFSAVALVSPPTLFRWSGLIPPFRGGPLPPFYWQGWWMYTWFVLPKAAGFAVAISWLTLALSGRWAADRGWPDRLGRLLGSCWIGLAVLRLLASWLWLVT
jgi:hypothetical protein